MRARWWLVAFAWLIPAIAAAHDIPRSLTVHVRVEPRANVLRLELRTPATALRDMQFPPDDLREGIARWILPDLAVYEDGDALRAPSIVGVRLTPTAEVEATLEYAIRSGASRFSMRPGFERLGVEVVTVIQLVTPDGVRAFEFRGDPGIVLLDPRWHQAAWRFVQLGFSHILGGIDHLLFLVCLVLPLRRLKPLVVVVTAFTVAHSITLISAALGVVPDGLWFPPLVETLIAASIVYLALENIVAADRTAPRWIVAFAFGLVHGFGFSFALKDSLQLAGSHLLTSLIAFNVGVELGQVFVIAAMVPALQALFRFGVRERMGVIVISALVAHTAWHWMTERWDALRQFPAPTWDVWTPVFIVRLLLVIVAVAAIAWFLRVVTSRSSRTRTASEVARQPR